MATTSLPAPEASAAIGPVGRMTGVLFSPKKTFEDIVRKPTWFLPLIVLTVLSLVASAAINQRTNWRDYISQQIEKNPSTPNIPAEQKEQRIETGAKFSPPFVYVVGFLAPPILVLCSALLMWGGYNLLGGANTTFGTSMGITSHAFLTGLVSTPLFILILYLRPYGTVDLENPLAANVAAFLPEDVPKWLFALGKSIDLFALWTLVLLAIGFACTSPRKLKGGKSFGIALAVYGAFVCVRVLGAFILS